MPPLVLNLAHMVYDTHDLSTIRGGSFVLMNAIQAMAKTFQDRMTAITMAASQGLFVVDDATGEIAILLQEILAYLKMRTGGHATFLVASEPDSGDFPLVLERLQAQIRRQQWRMPTVAVPNFAAATDACFLDGWRPGVAHYGVDPEQANAKMSRATEFRRRVGREIKHTLFSRLLADEQFNGNLCARDLNKLASDSTKGVLDGKIALIHIDGNSFGSIRRALCQTQEERKQFDVSIQKGCREPFLRSLLTHARGDVAFRAKDDNNNPALRIEVLLWGGDELTMVVPAWRGWQVLDLYYQHAKNLHFKGVPLSHRAAIIFCHHNAPILQIRSLAEDLLDRTRTDIQRGFDQASETSPELTGYTAEERQKTISRLSNHRLGNAVHYLSLRSFDMLGGTLDAFLHNYYAQTKYQDLLLYAAEFGTVLDHLKLVHTTIPKGKVIEIVMALQMGDHERLALLRSRLLAATSPDITSRVANSLDALVGNKPGRWQLISDLWDFIPEWNI